MTVAIKPQRAIPHGSCFVTTPRTRPGTTIKDMTPTMRIATHIRIRLEGVRSVLAELFPLSESGCPALSTSRASMVEEGLWLLRVCSSVFLGASNSVFSVWIL